MNPSPQDRWNRKVVHLVGRTWTIVKLPSPVDFGLFLGETTEDQPAVHVRFRVEGDQVKIESGGNRATLEKVLTEGYKSITVEEMQALDQGDSWAAKKVWGEWRNLLEQLRLDLKRKLKHSKNKDT